jgi:hypothetical protein
MAGTLGKLNVAIASVQNEASASLATLNFDFTLIKLEAPVEFHGLGSTISHKRKKDAEEGRLHKTARRLGALFEGSLPPAEELFRAYGTRVSEISSMPTINPTEREGIFSSHIGADSSSIWAAVTSGSSAIAVHLLACMLARMFTIAPEAISIWVEIVEKQKEIIQARENSHLYSTEHRTATLASKQDISREDLANWDASARAWLQSGDQAKEFQHKQTRLIMDSARLPVNNEPETYTSVMSAWKVALEAMNNLVKGLPQRVHDGATLLAASSWHLYPDIAVFGDSCVEVKLNDPIFEPSALLTLGLQHLRDDVKSVYWSLPLSRLQYYGHPIHISRTAGKENTRITCEQFAYVVLGCVFAGWRSYATTNDEGVNWIQKLAGVLDLNRLDRFDHANKPTWILYLVDAVDRIVDYDESEKNAAYQLMNLGRRRSAFLHPPAKVPCPLFGLSQINVLLAVLKGQQQRIQFLRHLCPRLKLEPSQFLIKYSSGPRHQEYASVTPVRRSSLKRSSDGTVKGDNQMSDRHARWFGLELAQLALCIRMKDDLLNLARSIEKLRQLEEAEEKLVEYGTVVQQQRQNDIRDLRIITWIAKRQSEIEALGESFRPMVELRLADPNQDRLQTGLLLSPEDDFFEACEDLLKAMNYGLQSRAMKVSCHFFAGDFVLAALCSRTSLRDPVTPLRDPVTPLQDPILKPEHLQDFITAEKFDKQQLYTSLLRFRNAGEQVMGLRACAMMADIYKLLPGATISTLVVGQSLSKAKWIPKADRSPEIHFLTLPQAFACIAMFESGTCNIDPSTLSEAFAMSSGNSLYIAGALLCDPIEEAKPTEIRRVIGNIGRSGITFLISPPEVKQRDADPEKWMQINHYPFDGKHENHFKQTSVHLSFTEYVIPLIAGDNPHHIIDKSAVLVETLISVYDKRTWVAEIDLLKASGSTLHRVPQLSLTSTHKPERTENFPNGHIISYNQAKAEFPQLAAVSVENWDELIEAPPSGMIAVRAHKNWLARLAAMAVCIKQGFVPIILGDEICWTCCAELIQKERDKESLLRGYAPVSCDLEISKFALIC